MIALATRLLQNSTLSLILSTSRIFIECLTLRVGCLLGLTVNTVGCRLDRFYTPCAWRPHMHDFHCTPFAYSDHQIISNKLSLRPSNLRGRGVWKFNTQLLKSEAFCSAVADFWPSWHSAKSHFTASRVWWDSRKLQLKDLAIRFGVELSRARKQDKEALEHEFQSHGS